MRAEREEDIIWSDPPEKRLKEIDLWAIGVGHALKENKGQWGIIYSGDDANRHYMAIYHNNRHVWQRRVTIQGIDYLYAIYSTKDPT